MKKKESPKYDYYIYTDGAYSRKHDEGAFAYVMLNSNGKEIKRGAWKITHETNNRAELKAIITAIHHLPDDAKKVKIFSDSQYALNTLFGFWGRSANVDLFDVFERVKRKKDVEIAYAWVKGHSGDKYNDLCDKLCNDVLGYDANAEFDIFRKKKEELKQKR